MNFKRYHLAVIGLWLFWLAVFLAGNSADSPQVARWIVIGLALLFIGTTAYLWGKGERHPLLGDNEPEHASREKDSLQPYQRKIIHDWLLRKARGDRNLTQKAYCNQLGFDDSTLRIWISKAKKTGEYSEIQNEVSKTVK